MTDATHRGTFGHVWPCPLFYVGNWRQTEEGYRPTVECTSPHACEPATSDPVDDDDLTATSYEVYRWDCPRCGNVNETGDVQPSGEERCDDCGAIVEVN